MNELLRGQAEIQFDHSCNRHACSAVSFAAEVRDHAMRMEPSSFVCSERARGYSARTPEWLLQSGQPAAPAKVKEHSRETHGEDLGWTLGQMPNQDVQHLG